MRNFPLILKTITIKRTWIKTDEHYFFKFPNLIPSPFVTHNTFFPHPYQNRFQLHGGNII